MTDGLHTFAAVMNKQAVQTIPFIGQKTNTAAAIRLLRDEVFQERYGDRINVPNFAVVVTGTRAFLLPA